MQIQIPLRWVSTALLLLIGNTISAQQTTTKKYELWYNAPAPNRGSDYSIVKAGGKPFDADWENWSLPIGNGYLGASVFGRTDIERVQLTENSLSNKGLYGIGSLTNFAELFIDFNQPNFTNYRRSLSLDNATMSVQYISNGVEYSRTYFASYPDKVLVIKLKASAAGKLAFTLRPTIPYLKNSDTTVLKDDGRTGTVTANGNLITLSGNMQYYNINYEGQFKVMPSGGKLVAENDAKGDHGKIIVSGADSAIIMVALGTNYQLKSSVFTEPVPNKKLAGIEHPHQKITAIMAAASKKAYAQLLQTHVKDYQQYYSRVQLDLGSKVSNLPTDQLLAAYKAGIIDHYLEELYFQYGRYLLIASSRQGTLPSNLQGIWSQYDVSPWTSGYWHNVNVQMNYWPAFNTNLAELFTAYVDYNKAFRAAALLNANRYVKNLNPAAYDSTEGGNGWAIGTGASAYAIHSPGSHSGPGTGGFTTKLFWDNYDFTRDKKHLKEFDFPTMQSMAKFLSKVVKEKNGLLLTDPSASPEQKVNNKNYETIGCAFDQEMIYENHHDVLKAAKILGDNNPFIAVVQSQIDKLDPIQVGWSGQIKEYREEKKYGDIGEYHHRHISQLVGLFPGTVINSTTPAWLDAAKVTLNERGDVSKGWSMAHRLNAWSRIKDGNRAYKLYQTLLQQGTFDNLWDSHPPFQIDGNFGGTAGVAEMLLQSHEDCIEPLAALPAAWASGSFSGLVARGNFEMAVTWKNAQAQRFQLLSKVGGPCVIKYPNIERALLKDAVGKIVPFKKLHSGLISFATVKGQRYALTSIPAVIKVEAPQQLQIAQLDSVTLKLNWALSKDAKTYCIYKAVGSAPTYELVAKNIADPAYQFAAKDLATAERATIKVTAISKEGVESNGVLAYWVSPTAKP